METGWLMVDRHSYNRGSTLKARSFTIDYYKWFVFDRERPSRILKEGQSLTLTGCQSQAKLGVPVKKGMVTGLCIEKQTLPVNNDMKMMEAMYAWLLRNKINRTASRECRACEEEQPNQMAHMDIGCLMEFDNAVDTYLKASEAEITILDMIKLYSDFLALVGLEMPSCVKDIAISVKNNVDAFQMMKTYIHNGIYYSSILDDLFSQCYLNQELDA